MENREEGMGDANYSGGGDFYKTWKLRVPDVQKNETETRLVRRLFGPMKSLKKEGKGRWFQYVAVHYGYEGVSPKDPSKRRARPFACLFRDDQQTRLVLEECEKCDDISAHLEARDRAEEGYAKEGKSKDAIKVLVKPMREWERKHNRDGKYYFCGMDPATDEYGVLLLTPKCKNRLIAVIREHLKSWPKMDPLKPDQGVLFEFVRTGKGFEIVDDVKIVHEPKIVDGEQVGLAPKLAPLTSAQVARAMEVCPDLSPGAQEIAKFLTHDQISQLVACSGDPEEVDRIWNQGQHAPGGRRRRAFNDEDAGETQEGSGGASSGETVKTAEPPKQEKKEEAKPKPVESEEDKEVREAEERVAALKAKRAAAKPEVKAEAKPASGPAPDPSEMENLSDEDFASTFGDK